MTKSLEDQVGDAISQAIQGAYRPVYNLVHEACSIARQNEKKRILAILEPFCKESAVVSTIYEKIYTEGFVE